MIRRLFTLLMLLTLAAPLAVSTGCDEGREGEFEEGIGEEGIGEEGIEED